MGDTSKAFRVFSFWLIFSHFLVINCTGEKFSRQEDLDFILSGVTKIEGRDYPGLFTVYGEAAFPILSGSHEGIRKPIVAGARYGQGRIVVSGHTSFLYVFDSREFDNEKLLVNIINWAGNSNVSRAGIYRYGKNHADFIEWLRKRGITSTLLQGSHLSNSTFLRQFDVLFISKPDNWGAELAGGSQALKSFLSSGGGLILTPTSWSHTPPPGEHFRNSFWGNKVIGDMGLLFIQWSALKTIQGGFNASKTELVNTHAGLVVNELESLLLNSSGPIGTSVLKQMTGTLKDRVSYAARDDSLGPRIGQIFAALPTFVPKSANPVSIAREKDFLLAHRYLSEILNDLDEKIAAHPSANYFPGPVSKQTLKNRSSSIIEKITTIVPQWATSLNQEQIQKFLPNKINFCTDDFTKDSSRAEDIDVNASNKKWHSTGLYAPAGSVITVQILNPNNFSKVFEVQIGAHTDGIQGKSRWVRCPQIVYRKTIRSNNASLTNPFGGLIFINIINTANATFQISIAGGVPAPSFVLGKTSLTKWRNEIRYYDAPWGELIGKRIILSLRKENLRNLDNPEELIVLWDNMMDAISDLAAIPRERLSPERMVFDVEISAGDMHSGYPIMGYLRYGNSAANFTKIKTEPQVLWGHLHELGHNHQRSDWKFSGTGEVTCNLFVLYVLHTIHRIPTNMSTGNLSDREVKKRLQNYIANGKQFTQWKQDPFLALTTYIQLQERFGWEAYKQVFALYLQLPSGEKPGNDQQKMDLWMVKFSTVVEENLTPFFRSWSIPITEQAEQQVAHLPKTSLTIPSP